MDCECGIGPWRHGVCEWCRGAAPLVKIGPIRVWASRRTQIILRWRGHVWTWPK